MPLSKGLTKIRYVFFLVVLSTSTLFFAQFVLGQTSTPAPSFQAAIVPAPTPGPFDLTGLLSGLFGIASGGALVTYFLKRLISNYDTKFSEWEERVAELIAKIETSNEKWEEKYDSILDKFDEKQREMYVVTNYLRKDTQRLELELVRSSTNHECQSIRKAVQDITELQIQCVELRKDIASVAS